MAWKSSWASGGSGGRAIGGSGVTILGDEVTLFYVGEPADPGPGQGLLFFNSAGDLCVKINISGVIRTARLTETSFMGDADVYPEIFLMQG